MFGEKGIRETVATSTRDPEGGVDLQKINSIVISATLRYHFSSTSLRSSQENMYVCIYPI